MAPKFIKSKRGGKILVSKGYQYHKHSTKKERTYWVCALKPECTARATTVSDPPVVVKEAEHSHAPDQDDIAAKEILNDIKWSSVEQPEAPPIQITSNKLQKIPQVGPQRGPRAIVVRHLVRHTFRYVLCRSFWPSCRTTLPSRQPSTGHVRPPFLATRRP